MGGHGLLFLDLVLFDTKREKFLALEQGNMTITTYKAKFHTLSIFATQILDIQVEKIFHFMKVLNTNI